MKISKIKAGISDDKRAGIVSAAVIGVLVVAAILIIGTLWTGSRASRDTKQAVRNVSLLYLLPLTGSGTDA